jgi:hypothetical protein
MTTTNRYEVEHKLLAKAFSDRAFLMHLHGNPKGAVEQFLGTALPADLKVQLLIEDAKTLYALLPHPSHTALGDLGMPSQLTKDAREQFEAALVAKIASDPSFLQQFRADPTSAVRTLAPLAAGVTVKIAEEPADTLFIIIPYYGKSTYRA